MSAKINVEKIVVGGKTYVAEDSVVKPPSGPRAVVVVDRGRLLGKAHGTSYTYDYKMRNGDGNGNGNGNGDGYGNGTVTRCVRRRRS